MRIFFFSCGEDARKEQEIVDTKNICFFLIKNLRLKKREKEQEKKKEKKKKKIRQDKNVGCLFVEYLFSRIIFFSFSNFFFHHKIGFLCFFFFFYLVGN